MAVNLSAIKDLLLPGLRGIEGKYEMIPSQYDKIFTKHDSKMALERTAEMPVSYTHLTLPTILRV